MAVQGSFTVFDRSKLYIGDGSTDLLLPTSDFQAVLTTSSQVISESFVGTSGNCQYSDLTAELPTAVGYSQGGVALSGVTIFRSSSAVVEWSSASAVWFLTGPITFKYLVIYNASEPRQNLLGYVDMDLSGGSVNPAPGALTINPNPAGWFSYT